MLKEYIKEIFTIVKQGDAREESCYKALASLLEVFAQSTKRAAVRVTIQPKKTEAGNPDFRIWDGREHITGYIEAKHSEEDLDKAERSEQLKRYRSAFANVILTNFFEFRLYRNGDLIDKVQTGRQFIAGRLNVAPPVENKNKFLALLTRFFDFSLPKTYTPKTLAQTLAARTHYLREQIDIELERKGNGLEGFFEAFKQHLIAGLTKQEFADIYAQTITYGLFAARTRCEKQFTRKLAFDNIPRTIGILRDVFRYVSLEEPPPELSWIIDDIAEVLAVAEVKQILHEYFAGGAGADPIVHFYETFLAEYNPQERELRGVYYTPTEVVSYIVRSLNVILKEYFDKADGFATDSVTVLDPAAGTLTFPAEAAKIAVGEFATRYGAGGVSELIKKHILENFYAFELMMAPYAIGHLKMGFMLEELGYELKDDDRFKLYLTNTLEMKELAQSNLPGTSSLSVESHAAGEVKRDAPILVVLGNPPYSGHSANKGAWISKEIKEYYKVDGKALREKNPKWLQDDYVKFIRFAQWKIDQAGEGALGFITNHSYLDNPTFRGMRRSLMNSFDHIYILDLHGNSKKKEKCPDGLIDKNVFEIRQGVAIILAVKKKTLEKKIVHADCWGLRREKCDWLQSNDIKSTRWKTLDPASTFYFFVPRDERLLASYEKYPKVTDIFPVNSVGIVTSRDKFVIDISRDKLANRLRMFCDNNTSDSLIKQTFGLKDSTRWKLKDARENITRDRKWEKEVVQMLYRPFDQRWIFYNDAVVERTRKDVMRHMMQENVGLLTCRQQNTSGFFHAFVSDMIAESCVVSDKTREINYLFPLYIYPEVDLFNGGSRYKRQVNISAEISAVLEKTYKKRLKPEAVFCYIYAVLYSDTYRRRYSDFLKSDFPRIPFCADYDLFKSIGRSGKNLVDLHLMKSKKLDRPAAKFDGKGNNTVDKPVYDQKKERVYINAGQYFAPVGGDIWEYRIGGYQVMGKWIKSRKGRRLSLEEIRTYCRIAAIVKETMKTQKKIEELYAGVEKECVE
ncbi:MAG: DNA methyltransferase [Planctomycetota bacterium]|nr:MAG: DNA methyltransferase [Planctomycetota bacterium]